MGRNSTTAEIRAEIGTEIGEDAALTVSDPRAAAVTAAIALVVLALVVLALCSLRVVPTGQRMVIFRLGQAARLRGPGVVAVLPGVDRGVRVPVHARWYDVTWLDATTRDAVRVTVTAAASGVVREPVRYALAGPPAADVVWALEAELRRCVTERDLIELATGSATGFPALTAAVSARTAQWGIEITDVEVTRIEVRVDQGLVRWASELQ